jgi:hypothetical protein
LSRLEVEMFDRIELGSEFFEGLTAIDEAIVEKVAISGCPQCGGPLHRGDYPRKPRAGVFAIAAEAFARRFSLCCGREGCRSRATPPSVRFLGRRVYVGAVVIIASVVALTAATAAAIRRTTGVPPRTARRWMRWWKDSFPATSAFVEISGRLVPSVPRQTLPASILARLAGDAPTRIGRLLAWLAPITTTSTPDGSRFVRGVA